MGLNPQDQGRGRGWKRNFLNRGRHGGGTSGQGPMFTSGTQCPTQNGTPPEPVGSNFYGKSSGCKFKSQRPWFRKFPSKNFIGKNSQKNDKFVPEIDLTKPWVTEQIKMEDTVKQELLKTWKETKNDEDWSKYQGQKLIIQTLYNTAKAQYLAAHPHEAMFWMSQPTTTSDQKYFCEICDKSFKSDDALILHEAEHETCGIDGCEFTAHPNIIAKHIKMQHDSGLYQKIGKLQTEEDIAKWIEERKKRYPSRKVIEEKKALEQEKMDRGERIKDDDSRFNKSFQNKNKKTRQFEKKISKTGRKKISRRNRKVESTIQYLQEEDEPTIRHGVPAFLGTKKSFEPDKPETPEPDLNISDEEWETEDKVENGAKPLINNSLGLLAACYDSEEEVSEKECPEQSKPVDDDGSEPEEVKTVCEKGPLPEENTEEKKPFKRKQKGEEKGMARNKRMKNSTEESNTKTRDLTLLEKLLKNEIRHERNVILQCVHYIVKNNFFKTS